MKPYLTRDVEDMQFRSKVSNDLTARERNFSVGDLVYVSNFGEGSRWLAGKVVQMDGESTMFAWLGVTKTKQDANFQRIIVPEFLSQQHVIIPLPWKALFHVSTETQTGLVQDSELCQNLES